MNNPAILNLSLSIKIRPTDSKKAFHLTFFLCKGAIVQRCCLENCFKREVFFCELNLFFCRDNCYRYRYCDYSGKS